MEVLSRIQVDGTVLAVLVHVLDSNTALQVNEGHVTLYSRTVQCSGCDLASTLARLIPWRSADCEPLAAGDYIVKSVQRWSGDQRRLVGNPEMLDGFKCVGPDDTAISQTSLEDRPPVVLCPFCADSGMILTQLQEIAEQRYAGYLRQTFDLGLVGGVEVPDQKVTQSQKEKGEGRGRQ